MTGPMTSDDELDAIDAYWRAANYLTVGQIYLVANPLLREPLRPEHIKPRLLGHWGTSPGLSLIYAHVNRVIRSRDANMIFLAGPGHGGPAVVANVYLEGTYSEVYPGVTEDTAGIERLFRQFSTPGGVPSHVGPQTPGSIHEGGELGYVLTHAFGAVFDNPDLIAVAVVGDGEAETAPLEGSWKGIQFLNAARDGAVLPILHLNGYKIEGRPCSAAPPTPRFASCSRATATRSTSSSVTSRAPSTAGWPPRSTRAWTPSARRRTRRGSGARAAPCAGR
jgi:xylulose-5-phosphate/fructose-6-phosphate phosphoketolase